METQECRPSTMVDRGECCTWTKESSRIAAAGGYVIDGRVNGNLNLSRALGDMEYKKDNSITPEK